MSSKLDRDYNNHSIIDCTLETLKSKKINTLEKSLEKILILDANFYKLLGALILDSIILRD
jgi:hypothetical protein